MRKKQRHRHESGKQHIHGKRHDSRAVAGRGAAEGEPSAFKREASGSNAIEPEHASGEPTVGNPGGQEGLGTLLQGYTEQSNVNVVEEFINLIVSQRAYEANAKVVKAADDMYQQVNNLNR